MVYDLYIKLYFIILFSTIYYKTLSSSILSGFVEEMYVEYINYMSFESNNELFCICFSIVVLHSKFILHIIVSCAVQSALYTIKLALLVPKI